MLPAYSINMFSQAGHSDNIVEVYFSPDGRYPPQHNTMSCINDQSTGKWEWRLHRPILGCIVQCIAWSPDGLYLASGDKSGEVRFCVIPFFALFPSAAFYS